MIEIAKCNTMRIYGSDFNNISVHLSVLQHHFFFNNPPNIYIHLGATYISALCVLRYMKCVYMLHILSSAVYYTGYCCVYSWGVECIWYLLAF